MRRLAAAIVLAAFVASAPGCGRAGAKVQNGIDYYESGAYEGALIKFRAIDADESKLRTKTRARYLVYRGLAHWHMKQNDDARRYLGEAKKAFADGGDPKWVPSDVREELAKAESELGLADATLPAKPGVVPAGSSPPDRPSPPGTPPGPPDGAPTPAPDKPPADAAPSPSPSPSSPTSSPPGGSPGSALPPSTTPAPEPL